MKKCETCRFWSERLAFAEGGGPVMAYCLAGKAERRDGYTAGRFSCASWKSNHLGAIDDPTHDVDDPYVGEPDDGFAS